MAIVHAPCASLCTSAPVIPSLRGICFTLNKVHAVTQKQISRLRLHLAPPPSEVATELQTARSRFLRSQGPALALTASWPEFSCPALLRGHERRAHPSRCGTTIAAFVRVKLG